METLNRTLLIFGSLLVIVNPLAVIPSFLSLTSDYQAPQTKATLRLACLTGAEVLIFFHLFGASVFAIMGIELDAFRVAGGVLLFLSALEMLKEKRSTPPEHTQKDIAIFPLAVPLMAGPGSITSVMLYTNDPLKSFVENTMVAIPAITAVFLISFIVLTYAGKIQRVLGESGLAILQKMTGILLAALSLQMIVKGSVALVKSSFGS